jgi:hypothetical protein
MKIEKNHSLLANYNYYNCCNYYNSMKQNFNFFSKYLTISLEMYYIIYVVGKNV